MANAKQKILIVEDDIDVAEMVTAYFRAQGYEVLTVNWGEDGVRACQANHPDLAILDIRLPDIDGYEVARRLRSDRRTSDVPIIFLTEKRERADKLQGLELGADDYITKPFDIQELRLRVRNALQRISQGSLTNPVSGLPEGALVDERLTAATKDDGLSLLLVSLENLDAFREIYGFVASDDVLRAFSMMIHNTMMELGAKDDFLGHLGPAEFVLVMQAANLPSVQERLRSRLTQSLDYFYPIKDRERASQRSDRLAVKMSDMAAVKGRFASVDKLKVELLRLKR
ncbi:MAG: response regulator [Anaerolineaceae bacterium]|nr:MAG: response regulator [Anaerolineaceae bacterium]